MNGQISETNGLAFSIGLMISFIAPLFQFLSDDRINLVSIPHLQGAIHLRRFFSENFYSKILDFYLNNLYAHTVVMYKSGLYRMLVVFGTYPVLNVEKKENKRKGPLGPKRKEKKEKLWP